MLFWRLSSTRITRQCLLMVVACLAVMLSAVCAVADPYVKIVNPQNGDMVSGALNPNEYIINGTALDTDGVVVTITTVPGGVVKTVSPVLPVTNGAWQYRCSLGGVTDGGYLITVATSAVPSATDSAGVTLSTAFPGAALLITPSVGNYNVFAGPHSLWLGVVGYNITDGGTGYANGDHTVNFVGGDGFGATANVTVAGGVITAVTILSSGRGYYSLPTLDLASSGAGAGNDDFIGQAVVDVTSLALPLQVRAAAGLGDTINAIGIDALPAVPAAVPVTLSDVNNDSATGIPYTFLLPGGDGLRTLAAEVTDTAPGSVIVNRSVIVDTVPPTASFDATYTYLSSHEIKLTGKAQDLTSGIASVVIELTEPGPVAKRFPAKLNYSAEPDDEITWSAVANIDTDGPYTVIAYVTDCAGNILNPAPSIAVSAAQSLTPSLDLLPAFVKGTINVTGTNSAVGLDRWKLLLDGNQKAAGTDPAFSSYSWDTTTAGDGLHVWVLQLKDKANNTVDSVPVTTTVDNILPDPAINALAATVNAEASVTGYITEANLDTWALLMDGNQVANGTTCNVSYSLNGVADGDHTFVLHAVDKAGNQKDSAPVTTTVDNINPAPVINALTAFSKGTVAVGGTLNETNIKSWSLLKNGVKINTDTLPYSWDTTADPDGKYTLVLQVTDKAGNATDSASVSTIVDNTMPVSVLNALPAFVKRDIPITGTVTEENLDYWELLENRNGNEIRLTHGRTGVVTHSLLHVSEGLRNIFIRAYDKAGNKKDSDPITITIDSIPPSPELNPLPALAKGTITVSGICRDNNLKDWSILKNGEVVVKSSAPVKYTWNSVADPDGDYSFVLRATDKAGNTTDSAAVTTTIDNSEPEVKILKPSLYDSEGKPTRLIREETIIISIQDKHLESWQLIAKAPGTNPALTREIAKTGDPTVVQFDTRDFVHYGGVVFQLMARDTLGNAGNTGAYAPVLPGIPVQFPVDDPTSKIGAADVRLNLDNSSKSGLYTEPSNGGYKRAIGSDSSRNESIPTSAVKDDTEEGIKVAKAYKAYTRGGNVEPLYLDAGVTRRSANNQISAVLSVESALPTDSDHKSFETTFEVSAVGNEKPFDATKLQEANERICRVGHHRIKLTADNNTGAFNEASLDLVVDQSPVQTSILLPTSNAVVSPGGILNVVFTIDKKHIADEMRAPIKRYNATDEIPFVKLAILKGQYTPGQNLTNWQEQLAPALYGWNIERDKPGARGSYTVVGYYDILQSQLQPNPRGGNGTAVITGNKFSGYKVAWSIPIDTKFQNRATYTIVLFGMQDIVGNEFNADNNYVLQNFKVSMTR